MAYQRSRLVELATLRRRGSRPEHPVVIADDGIGAAWAMRNRYFLVVRADVEDDLTVFGGLDVWIRTGKPFADSAEFGFQLSAIARTVTITDSRGREPSVFVSSMSAAA